MAYLLVGCTIVRYACGTGSAALIHELCVLLHLLRQLIEMMLQY
jgi:hypothetical protein